MLSDFSLIPTAYAQSAASAPPPGGISMVPLVLIFVIFYFFVIRPQSKKIKEHEALVQNLKRGDKVATNGGIIGEITKVDKDNRHLEVEIAEGVKVKMIADSVTELVTLNSKEAKPAEDKKAKTAKNNKNSKNKKKAA